MTAVSETGLTFIDPPAADRADAGLAGRRLICAVGHLRIAIPLDQISETMRPLPVETLGQQPSFIAGISIIRGEAVPVVDVAKLLTADAGEQSGRFVTLRVAGRPIALAVGAVVGIREVASANLADLPPLLSQFDDGAVTAIGVLDAALLAALRTTQLVPEVVWNALANR